MLIIRPDQEAPTTGPTKRAALRAQLQRDVDEFIARGGKIRELGNGPSDPLVNAMYAEPGVLHRYADVELVPISSAALALGVHPQSLRNAINSGRWKVKGVQIPPFADKERRLFSRRDLAAAKAAAKTTQPDQQAH